MLCDPAQDYPATFIWTTTRDDRVHPGHARKMAAKMLAADKDVRYYENTESGHRAGATNKQSAHVWALNDTFLWTELARESVVWGKKVSVRVSIGGRRYSKKKKKLNKERIEQNT